MLEELDKLIGVFVADNVTLMAKIESALAARNVAEFRSHLHAMKGSAASMGAERLTVYCRDMGRLSDAEVKLQIPALLKTLRDELAATRESLERYLQERKKSTGAQGCGSIPRMLPSFPPPGRADCDHRLSAQFARDPLPSSRASRSAGISPIPLGGIDVFFVRHRI